VRVLFAIGCNSYEHADQLNEAEHDAQRIFDALIRPELGNYDLNRSRLLLSPTLDEVRSTLKDVLFSNPRPETFTLFYAGHGCVAAGSFYMWLKDSDPNGLSVSALSLGDLFRSLNESAPRQSNIIIDACEGGGLIEELGVLLKPSLLGDAGTPGLTLVATSAKNQNANETVAGGVGTVAILDCIEGRDLVQDHKSTLDLVEIGMRVSDRLRDSGQRPVVWGLNLIGAEGFCENPRFGRDPALPLRQALHTWPAGSDLIIKQNYDALWAAYSATGGVWNPKQFSNVTRAVLDPSIEPIVLASLADRLAVTFVHRALAARDPFRRVEVASTFAVALLASIDQEPVADTAQRLLDQACASLIEATAALVDALVEDRYALMSDRSGVLSELHELPSRLAKVLGWTAVATSACCDASQRSAAETLFVRALNLILENYGNSILSFNDAQASGWCIALSTCARLGLREEGEQIAGLLFNSIIQCKGNLARVDLPRDKALEYLLARRESNFANCHDLVARPIASLAVLLKASVAFNLEEVFNESLWKIDGLAFGVYLPSDYKNYGHPQMDSGENLVWTIGRDVFKVEDFAASWPAGKVTPQSPLVASLALMASLLYPDRQAWFLFDS
jgi:Caspase domain